MRIVLPAANLRKQYMPVSYSILSPLKMMLDATLARFSNVLSMRLIKGVFTTEDSVRYTFFTALLQQSGLNSEDVVLEYPHPSIAGAKIDTWIPSFEGNSLAIEFKYDRDIPSEKNTPRTQKAGKVFHDLYRLGQIKDGTRRLFIYLTGPEMALYFSNPGNGLTEFFSLPQGRTFPIDSAFISGKSSTFATSVSKAPDVVVGLYGCSLPGKHELRAYEVRNS